MSNVTLEDLKQIVADIGIAQRKTNEASDARMAAYDARIAESRLAAEESRMAAEESRRAAEARMAAYDARIAASRMAWEKRYQADVEASRKAAEESRMAWEKRYQADVEESRRKAEERREELERYLTYNISEMKADARRWVGSIRNRMGQVMEKVLIPGIRPLMNGLGHNFIGLDSNVEFFSDVWEFHKCAEVDLLLENSREVLVIEVKAYLRAKDVEGHLERLRILRENELTGGLKGKTLYGAMAALQIDKDAREAVLGNGMYLIEMVEDPKYVNVIKPENGLGKW